MDPTVNLRNADIDKNSHTADIFKHISTFLCPDNHTIRVQKKIMSFNTSYVDMLFSSIPGSNRPDSVFLSISLFGSYKTTKKAKEPRPITSFPIQSERGCTQ